MHTTLVCYCLVSCLIAGTAAEDRSDYLPRGLKSHNLYAFRRVIKGISKVSKKSHPFLEDRYDTAQLNMIERNMPDSGPVPIQTT